MVKEIKAKIDNYNAQGPAKTMIEGKEVAEEVLYSKRMEEVLTEQYPKASEALQIATYGMHIGRWEIARKEYPEGRVGYLKWREDMKVHHANILEKIMREQNVAQEVIDRVKFLVQKKQLRHDEETQALEDTACLVFLKYYFDDFKVKHEEARLIDIVKKTWKKMSEKAHDAALQLPFTPEDARVIQIALGLREE